MKARIAEYDYYDNRAVIDFDADFSETFDKYNGKDINIDIKLWRPKRSGAANRYMWVLIDRIAKELRITKNEVYREAIKEIGGVSEVLRMFDGAVEKFEKVWENQGLGWQVEKIPIGDGTTNVIAYYGSSTFDREQMTQLIENLIFEANSLEIDTETPDKALWWQSLEMEVENAEQYNAGKEVEIQ